MFLRLSFNKPAVVAYLTGADGVSRAPQIELTASGKAIYARERFAPVEKQGVFDISYSELGAAILDLTKEIHSPIAQQLINSHDNPYFEVIRAPQGLFLKPFEVNVINGTKHGPPRLVPSARIWSDSLNLGRNTIRLNVDEMINIFETLLYQAYKTRKVESIVKNIIPFGNDAETIRKIEDMLCRSVPDSAKARILYFSLRSSDDS